MLSMQKGPEDSPRAPSFATRCGRLFVFPDIGKVRIVKRALTATKVVRNTDDASRVLVQVIDAAAMTEIGNCNKLLVPFRCLLLVFTLEQL